MCWPMSAVRWSADFSGRNDKKTGRGGVQNLPARLGILTDPADNSRQQESDLCKYFRQLFLKLLASQISSNDYAVPVEQHI